MDGVEEKRGDGGEGEGDITTSLMDCVEADDDGVPGMLASDRSDSAGDLGVEGATETASSGRGELGGDVEVVDDQQALPPDRGWAVGDPKSLEPHPGELGGGGERGVGGVREGLAEGHGEHGGDLGVVQPSLRGPSLPDSAAAGVAGRGEGE